jgi:thiamine biosynthesis lipoprotein
MNCTHLAATETFPAMGCGSQISVVCGTAHDATELIGIGRRRIEHLERCWSRFQPASDVCRLNSAGGMPITVDPATVVLATAMVEAWWATDGAFDPTLLGALVGLGDASSWLDPNRVSTVPPGTSLRGTPSAIGVDAPSNMVQLPAGTTLDAGGIGKGLAADMVAEDLLAAGADGALVSIGGDVRVVGQAPQAGGWSIDVAAPFDGVATLATLRLQGGGITTSGTHFRRWTAADGTSLHHLLDPSTCRPTRTQLVAATVVAGTTAWAEAWTKAVLVRGADDVLPRLDELGLAALAVDIDGQIITNNTWRTFATSTPKDIR